MSPRDEQPDGDVRRADSPTDDRPGAPPESQEQAPRHRDQQADVRERADGGNAEQISDEANLRENPEPPD